MNCSRKWALKVSKIVDLADDIKLNLATPDIRIEAPIPGKAAVGIEVPNKENHAVMLRESLQSTGISECKIQAVLLRLVKILQENRL